MRVTLHKNFNPSNETFQLTKTEIEAIVIEDLIRYKRLYFSKYNKSSPAVLDVDNFVQELWGVSIEFGNIDQNLGEQEILGRLDPERQKIVVDVNTRSNPKSISFTIGHEAGHLSLHASMFRLENGVVKGWSDGLRSNCQNDKKRELDSLRKEWQANQYAAALLAPKLEVMDLLKENGLMKNNFLAQPVDLALYGEVFDNRFGLSRQALEIRLFELGIPCKNTKYAILTN
jgi:Zn-dependent peptidase ImmA (M78 family)